MAVAARQPRPRPAPACWPCPEAGAELTPSRRRIQNRRHHQDPHIPAEDQHRHAHRNQAHVHQHQKERAQQQLVGHRVQVLAQQAALLEQARQQAIQRVGQSRSHKTAQSSAQMPFQNGGHQERRQTDAQQRQKVGSGAEAVKSFAGSFVHGGFWNPIPDGTAWRTRTPTLFLKPLILIDCFKCSTGA